MLVFVKLCCCADSFLQQMSFTDTFTTLFPPVYDMLIAIWLRIVSRRVFTVHCILLHPRFALALRCSLRVVRGPFVSAFNATSKRVPELYEGRQCISTLSWSLGRIHSSRCYASSGCEIMRFISTELCCVLS